MIREAIISNLKLWLTDFIHLFVPPRCAACDIILQEEEVYEVGQPEFEVAYDGFSNHVLAVD